MGRLIDGDVLMELLTTAIMNMKGMAKFLDLEDDPEIKMEIKAYTDIANGVKDMPTIEPEPKWIPCSERLPEETEARYWVCTDGGYQCQCRWTNDVFGLGEGDTWTWKIFDIPQYSKVIAWMPLPEPYREEGE